MAQDPGHDGGLGEEGDDLPWSAAGGAAEDVDGEDPLEECGPVEAAGEDRGRDPGRRDDADVVGDEGRHSGNHVAAAGGVGSEDAVISEGVSSRRRLRGFSSRGAIPHDWRVDWVHLSPAT